MEAELPFLKLNFLEGCKYFDKFIICEFNYTQNGNIWRHVDGDEVKCTIISSNKEHGSLWADIEYVGVVTTYIRPIALN